MLVLLILFHGLLVAAQTCNKKAIAAVKSQKSNTKNFCLTYINTPRSGAKVRGLKPAAILSACTCILAPLATSTLYETETETMTSTSTSIVFTTSTSMILRTSTITTFSAVNITNSFCSATPSSVSPTTGTISSLFTTLSQAPSDTFQTTTASSSPTTTSSSPTTSSTPPASTVTYTPCNPSTPLYYLRLTNLTSPSPYTGSYAHAPLFPERGYMYFPPTNTSSTPSSSSPSPSPSAPALLFNYYPSSGLLVNGSRSLIASMYLSLGDPEYAFLESAYDWYRPYNCSGTLKDPVFGVKSTITLDCANLFKGEEIRGFGGVEGEDGVRIYSWTERVRGQYGEEKRVGLEAVYACDGLGAAH
ncbi:Hypothetical protein D9617_12g036750 [Elsinoe fawcettii]|nr:Hypothetical protein D9617_12g036750 [Elsinoe fawcettii]